MNDWTAYSEVDPEWAANFVQKPPDDTDIPTWRSQVKQVLKTRLATAEYPRTGLIVQERSIPVQGGEILIRTYVPESADSTETYPVLVDLHGGGYVLGTLDTDEIKCRSACVEHNICVVNVDYRLAPEYPWPTGLNDSYEAVKWVANHAEEIRGDLSKGFIVNGNSAGANFTCTIAQRARGDPVLKGKITGQLLQIPPTIHGGGPEGYPEKYKSVLLSYNQNKDDPILTRSNIQKFMDAYKPGPARHPEVSPLLAESLANLPPAYFQIAGGDPLRDEGLLYDQLLRENGTPTKVQVYPGVPHGFQSYMPKIKASLKWKIDFDDGLRWLLSFSQAG